MKPIGMTALMLLGACGASEKMSGSGERYTNASQGYSLEAPEGWQSVSDRGAMRFAPKAGRASITVRSAERLDKIEGRRLTNEALISDTQRSLQALPHAQLANKSAVDGPLPGESFTLTYEPSGQHRLYHRTHVVLLGTKHIFHVIYSVPDGEPMDEAVLRDVMSSLREEV